MAYFHNTNDTNIDDEFNSSGTVATVGKKKLLLVGAVLGLLIVGVILFFVFRDNGYSIVLEGDEEITIYKGTEYVEFGYHGYDKKGNDVTDRIEVDSNINTNKIGEYTITYSVGDASKVRNVSVIDKGVGDTYLHLKGDLTIYLEIGESYVEPGYSVIDTVDGNLSDKVSIDGNVNTSKAGTYKLVYSVVNSAGVTTSATRTVIVLGSEMSLTLSNSNKTSGPIYINIYVNDNYFDYLVLPDGEKVSENKYSYKVSSNGTYKFISYNTRGEKIEKSITVSNIVVETENNNTGTNNNNASSNNSGSNSNSSNNNGSGTGSNQTTPTVSVNTPKVYTSDNIVSGKTHPVRFMIKLVSSGNTIYYCEDENNKCNPTTKYSKQIVISKSVKKYIRYKACDNNGNCSNIGSYYVICEQNLVSKGSNPIANANGAKFYYQCDSSWSSKYLPTNRYTFCSGGCGYTAFAMVMTGLTKNYNITPVTILNDLKNTSGYYYEDSGMMFHTAMWKDYLVEKYDYGVSRLFFNYSSLPSENVSSTVVKERLEESLKMGHMIVCLIPGHYISLVGYTSDNYVIVFDPANGSKYRTITDLYNYYYDYKNRCTNNIDCGFGLAYEFYSSDGMSFKEWQSIG